MVTSFETIFKISPLLLPENSEGDISSKCVVNFSLKIAAVEAIVFFNPQPFKYLNK